MPGTKEKGDDTLSRLLFAQGKEIFLIPATLVLSLIVQLTVFLDFIDKFGWLLTTLITLLVAWGWAIYMWCARRPTTLSGDFPSVLSVRKYSAKHRFISIGIALLMSVVFVCVWFWKTSSNSTTPLPQQSHNTTTMPGNIEDSVTPPGGYPSVDEIQFLPSKEQVKQPPRVDAQKVNFTYKNASGIDLKLILFNCYYHHFPIDDPLGPKKAWRTWPFLANNRGSITSDFERGTGWYVFFVERHDTGERFQLGTKNIFYSEWPTMTVSLTGDEVNPFKADFSAKE